MALNRLCTERKWTNLWYRERDYADKTLVKLNKTGLQPVSKTVEQILLGFKTVGKSLQKVHPQNSIPKNMQKVYQVKNQKMHKNVSEPLDLGKG